MNPFIQKQADEFRSAVEHFKKDLSHVRTGQANPELVESIMINAYGTMTPIKQLGSITVPEPKLIVIQPWDKSVLKDIEKGIIAAHLGFSTVNDGTVIRLPMPPMSEENRKDLVKVVKEKAEKSRVSIRQIREKVKEAIEKNKSGGKNKQFDAVDSETKKAGKDTDPKKIGGIEVIVKGIDGDDNQVQRGLKVVPKEAK